MLPVLFILIKLIVALVAFLAFSILLACAIGMAIKLSRLQDLAKEIYLAGHWKAEGISAYHAAELWTRFRNEFGIPPGTATKAGVGDTYGQPPRKVRVG